MGLFLDFLPTASGGIDRTRAETIVQRATRRELFGFERMAYPRFTRVRHCRIPRARPHRIGKRTPDRRNVKRYGQALWTLFVSALQRQAKAQHDQQDASAE
jgi:hypothetical protein